MYTLATKPSVEKLVNSNQIFNAAIAAYSVSAAYELEILDELQHVGFVNVEDFCRDRDLHKASVSAIIATLCCFDICTPDYEKDTFKKGALFAEIYYNKGFFLWLTRGYGNLMQNLASIAVNSNRVSDFIKRDGESIAIASREQGSVMVDPYFEKVINELPFKTVVDLGCGSAERLIKLAKKYPNMRGIGIDINAKAVKFAQSCVAQEELSARITILHGDMTHLEAQSGFEEVDTLFSFFSGHDMWPKENCLRLMQNLRVCFPNLKRFLLCDTYRSNVVLSGNIPVFTLGFETVHAVAGQYVPSLIEWMDLFASSRWRCVQQYYVEAPFSTIFDLRPN
jgi:phenylpyruvate C(3)-methyltransferase